MDWYGEGERDRHVEAGAKVLGGVCCTRLERAVVLEPGRGSSPDASTSSRSPRRRPVGVRGVPVPAGGDHGGGSLVSPVRAYRDVEELLAERGVTVDPPPCRESNEA
jgi:hypothetical protein